MVMLKDCHCSSNKLNPMVLILSCSSTNEKSGPNFSLFSVFQEEVVLRAKIAKLEKSSWAHSEA